ncbi:c-type cytochrome biogenesis protein CcsB [Citricoccus muralis]|uniref:C-type cytochrome biogenesis protein CcsB n=1 Tax=Citricoccus muralis TaxID=169134 RepID=A0ABY8H5I3_9MICC|nr:c-type cytochrome biogenesis protein CcsB [Citricoccus muralis]WFP15970.1 c-type cytochrome biogenesis protein CcsB [Citricoccus muralis]
MQNTQPINEALASYSELFMLIAALVYTVTFFVFSWDMARSSASIRRMEAELESEHAAQVEQASARVSEKSLVTAGGGTEIDVATGEANADAQVQNERAARAAARREQELDSTLVDEDMEYTGTVKRPAANVAVALMIIGVLLHAFAVVARGIASSRVPWANLYEFMTSGALVIAVVYLVFLIRKDLRFVGTFVSGVVLLMMIAATIGFPTPVGNVQPALQSWWIVTHVSVAVAATGLFSLTFAMSLLQLFKQRQEAAQKAGVPTKFAFLRLVPPSFALENWSYRINAVSFVMWTFTVIAGAIWAEQAWGRYWNWDAKEVWSFVIWVVYAGYLHARATRGWTGTRAAWLNMVGFGCLVFNYTIVNIYFPSLHSYAGL